MSAEESSIGQYRKVSAEDIAQLSEADERFFPVDLSWKGDSLRGAVIFVPGENLERLCKGDISPETQQVFVSLAGDDITIRTDCGV